MTPKDFIKTLYLGDRACKKIVIDTWECKVMVQVDLISRVREISGNWNFYTEEDIPDGFIVFTGVESVKLNPTGVLPNDFITSFEVEDIEMNEVATLQFKMTIISVSENHSDTEVILSIIASGLHLANPSYPNTLITD